MSDRFIFSTRFNLVKLLGIRARDPVELLSCLKTVPRASIYYHTHRFLQQHSYLSPEPPNDFAYWLTNIMNLKALGEAFASVDTVSFESLDELRKSFVEILARYIAVEKSIVKSAPGEEFHFMSCTTFILPTTYAAANLQEFVAVLKKVSIDSLYFHIFEARMRLGKSENDFARWFRAIGEPELAAEVLRLDPYTFTLESLRSKIINLAEKHAEH